MKKTLKISNFGCIKRLIGTKFDEMFFVPVAGILSSLDVIVFNFNSEKLLSLHVFSFVRIVKNNKILFSSSDMYFKRYEKIKGEELQQNDDETLLQETIEKLERLFVGRTVKKVSINSMGDLRIVFDNSLKIEIIADSLYSGFECYRLLCFEGEYVYHHVISYDENQKALYEVIRDINDE